ncbi:protein of unknown function [Nocardia cyriacigeorgica GUH-2]|uniref:Uncharacterized protein n=1 Tax=Nocardia cyriacigeorgica (strain GUH-2) TaxID=1127134 RepID=H6R829_NOCCG|nr:protein of unknown function [Nocardia cyriacigeorgica GUH-2]
MTPWAHRTQDRSYACPSDHPPTAGGAVVDSIAGVRVTATPREAAARANTAAS